MKKNSSLKKLPVLRYPRISQF